MYGIVLYIWLIVHVKQSGYDCQLPQILYLKQTQASKSRPKNGGKNILDFEKKCAKLEWNFVWDGFLQHYPLQIRGPGIFTYI